MKNWSIIAEMREFDDWGKRDIVTFRSWQQHRMCGEIFAMIRRKLSLRHNANSYHMDGVKKWDRPFLSAFSVPYYFHDIDFVLVLLRLQAALIKYMLFGQHDFQFMF